MDSQLEILALNFLYAILGAVIGTTFGILLYWVFRKHYYRQTGRSVEYEIANRNMAVAGTVKAILLGISMLLGLILGLGLN